MPTKTKVLDKRKVKGDIEFKNVSVAYPSNKKIFVLLLVISVIIVLCAIWLPKKDVELSHYKQFSDEEIDAKVSKEYGNDLLYSFEV